ncbi:MAG TPA: hypothetical protein VGN07_09790 [Steroidobacteraceae bacterium]|jgi:hypothetical protein
MNDSAGSPDGQLLALRQAARQLIFRTGIDCTPIALSGTYFLLAYRDKLFALTARHVVGDATPEQLLLLTSDKSLVPARVLEQINPSDEISGALDLVVYDLDIRHFNRKHRRNSRAYNLLVTEPSWLPTRHESSYFLFGYPLTHAKVDYGARTTQTHSQQWFLEGRYKGPSEISNCHMLNLCDTQTIGDLNGLSGSPVFASFHAIGMGTQPIFAGIVLRGTVMSGLVHFLDAGAVRAVLEQILLRPRKPLPKRWSGVKTRDRRSPSQHG